MTLRQQIEQEIRECGPIPFSRYMELCLYHPELGYYSRNAEQFGKAGDFYTSSDVHAVFGRLLARQFEEMWRVLGSPVQIELLELGPGRGLFAQDVLDWSEKKFPEFYKALHYSLLERSPALRERLQTGLARNIAAGRASLLGAGTVPAAGVEQYLQLKVEPGLRPCVTHAVVNRALAPEAPLLIFANEFFDALPVEILSTRGELRISAENGRFIETWAPTAKDKLDFLDHYGVHPEAGERIEVPLATQDWMSGIAATIPTGFVVAIDYGYTRAEQLAGRHRETLTVYRHHSVSASPYQAPGEQDLTAHVNFTALAAAAQQNGMQVQPLFSQSQFLLGIGEQNQFADAFEECRLPQEQAKVALQLKHLVTPAGVGETFHVLVASKGIARERVSGLSGLSFGSQR